MFSRFTSKLLTALNHMEHNSYPTVILPDKLFDIFFSPLPSLKKPTEPAKPILEQPQQPVKPVEPSTFVKAWGCGLLTIGIFTLIIYGISTSKDLGKSMEDIPGLFLIVLYAAPIISIGAIYSYHKNANNEKSKYKKDLLNYKEALKKYEYDRVNYKLQFEKDILTYQETTFPSYVKKLQQYEQEKQNGWSSDRLKIYKQKLISIFFLKANKPVKIDNNYITGVSEKQFFDFLKEKSNDFHKDLTIIKNQNRESYYLPDITYYNSESGVLIDIEVDEPYLGSDGTPLHYVGYDKKRNDFFGDNGWIVIRFAEEQVVKYPEQCFKFIEEVISDVRTGKFPSNNSFLHLISFWTKEEAYKMAFARTRNKYLNKNLIEKIQQEVIIEERDESYDEIEIFRENIDDLLKDFHPSSGHEKK